MEKEEVLIFPEPQEILFKEDRILLDNSYRVVVCDHVPPLEMEAAEGLVEKIEGLTRQRLEIVRRHQASEKQNLIFVGKCFQDVLATKLDCLDPEGYVLEIDGGRVVL